MAIINKVEMILPSVINNEINPQPSTTASETTYYGFVLIRTHQAGIVARNHCCDRNQAGLSAYAVKLPFVVKSKKLTQPNRSQPNVLDIVSLMWDFSLYARFIGFSQYSFRPSSTKLRCFSPSVINIELHLTINNNSFRDNLRPVSSLLGLIRQA